jgi:hypothetical protein
VRRGGGRLFHGTCGRDVTWKQGHGLERSCVTAVAMSTTVYTQHDATIYARNVRTEALLSKSLILSFSTTIMNKAKVHYSIHHHKGISPANNAALSNAVGKQK